MTKMNGFIKLDRDLVRSDKWQCLSSGARALLIEIWSWHNGSNNGSIRYGVRQAEISLKCTRPTALKMVSRTRGRSPDQGHRAWRLQMENRRPR